jgi:membrane protein
MKIVLKKVWLRIRATCVYFYKFVKSLISRINEHNLYPKGAELAYYLAVSALSAIVAMVYAAHFFQGLIDQISKGVYLLFPLEIADWIMSVIHNVSVPGSIPVLAGTVITIIWFVSRAMHSMMRSLNIIYNTNSRGSVIKSKAFSILFTLALVVLFIVIFLFSVLQHSIGAFLAKNFEYTGFFSTSGFSILISLGLMMLVFTLLYYYLPNRKTGLMGSLPGAIYTTAVWFGLSKGFSYYVNNLNALSWVLGSFGSIFIFLVWIYRLSIVVLTGAEINYMIIERRIIISNRQMHDAHEKV